eukprot:Pgem_evm1s10115
MSDQVQKVVSNPTLLTTFQSPHIWVKITLIVTSIIAFAMTIHCSIYPYKDLALTGDPQYRNSSEFLVGVNILSLVLSVFFIVWALFRAAKKFTVFPEIGITLVMALLCIIAGGMWAHYVDSSDGTLYKCNSSNKTAAAFSIVNCFLWVASAALLFFFRNK